MKRFLGNKREAELQTDEKITDAMLGTGEHMCTCAALVADIIIEQGQDNASLKELLGRLGKEANPVSSAAEKIP